MKKAYLLISGKVQGVFYRQSMKDEAEKLGLMGWVRNLPSGAVEAEIFGTHSDINKLIQWCEKGPPHASVLAVETKFEDWNSEAPAQKFEVRR